MQPGGNNRGIVAEQAVAGPQVFPQIAEVTMLDGVRGTVYDQQSRLIASVGRFLRDQPPRELIIEELCFHLVPRD